jgi:CelD/BcsL family acetyltransferase involved in cellulose biosynthesis
MARRSKGFRKEARRIGRRIADEGGVIRLAAPEELDRAVPALLRLYRARWTPRGGSARTSEAVQDMVLEAGGMLAGAGRFAIWLLEIDSEPVGAELFVRAGEESAAWGGGFVPEHARLAPSIMLMLAAVEHGARRGVHRFDLGEGAQSYKLKFADRDAGAEWATLYPRGPYYPRARLTALPRHARWWARERLRGLPPRVQLALKRPLRRG